MMLLWKVPLVQHPDGYFGTHFAKATHHTLSDKIGLVNMVTIVY